MIGTGKRVGKTAVTGHIARLLARDRRRRGRRDGAWGAGRARAGRDTADASPTCVALSRAGRHAASDHLEVAALAGVPTVGCRRAGGGMAGAPFASNVLEGARVAAALEPDVVVFDGSGAAIPPIATSARMLVAHDLSGLNRTARSISDLVMTMSDEPSVRRVHAAAALRSSRSRAGSPSSRPGRVSTSISTPRSCTSRGTSHAATCCATSSRALEAERISSR